MGVTRVGGAGRRRTQARAEERFGYGEAGGAGVEHGHRGPVQRQRRAVDKEPLDAARAARDGRAAATQVEQPHGVGAARDQRPARERERAAEEGEAQRSHRRLLEQRRADPRQPALGEAEEYGSVAALAHVGSHDAKGRLRHGDRAVTQHHVARTPLHAHVLPAELLVGVLQPGVAARPSVGAPRRRPGRAVHQEEWTARVDDGAKGLLVDGELDAVGASAKAERQHLLLLIGPGGWRQRCQRECAQRSEQGWPRELHC